MERKEEWIALFKKDYISKVFLKPGSSDEVLYWIKRHEDGRFHIPVTTGNIYSLRSFEFYDANLNVTSFRSRGTNKWVCESFREKSLDAHGSFCECDIKDPDGYVVTLLFRGMNGINHGGFQTTIDGNLYMSVLMFFLKRLSSASSWKQLEIEDEELHNHLSISKSVPTEFFYKIEQREYKLREYLNNP